MSINVLPPPTPVTTRDRLGFTLLVAVVFHFMLLFGVGFVAEPVSKKPLPANTLEIVMLESTEPQEKNDKADFLAPVSQAGGGETEDKAKPTSPPDSPLPSELDTPGEQQAQLIPLPSQPVTSTERVLTQLKPGRGITQNDAEITPQNLPQPMPDANQLVMRSKQLASLAATPGVQYKAFAKQPRQRYITASTREYSAAAYMEGWRSKVERLGNLNYPEEAGRLGISGTLVLDVALWPDGSVKEIKVDKSSGKKVLDDAAIRIVTLAAPFAPFPPEIRKETDILHVIRTWQFQTSGLSSSAY